MPLVLLGAGFVVAGLLLLDVVGGAGLHPDSRCRWRSHRARSQGLTGQRDEKVAWLRAKVDIQDLVAIGLIYIVVCARLPSGLHRIHHRQRSWAVPAALRRRW
jgi:hypothetical protein